MSEKSTAGRVPRIPPDEIMTHLDDPLSESWLASVGFKWHQMDRQPSRHWMLWIASVLPRRQFVCHEDLGIEVADGAMDGEWFCWLRADTSGRYHRFIHLRHIRTPRDLVRIIEGITGEAFIPADCQTGLMLRPEVAARRREEWERLDLQILADGHSWHPGEKDDTRGRALPEHRQAYEEARKS